MTSTDSSAFDSPPLKTDALGRIHVKPEQREAMLDAFEHSNMSAVKFAEHHGIKYTTLSGWIQRRRRERREYEPRREPVPNALIESLVELDLSAGPGKPERVTSTSASSTLRLEHASGLRMIIADAHQARLAAILISQLNATEPC